VEDSKTICNACIYSFKEEKACSSRVSKLYIVVEYYCMSIFHRQKPDVDSVSGVRLNNSWPKCEEINKGNCPSLFKSYR